MVTLPRVVTVYDVRGDSIAGFREVTLPRATTAVSSGPQEFRYPTFSDPTARRMLVQVLRGELSGQWVSPQDDGVSWSPAPGDG